jgi:hypothetical protein
MTTPGSIYPKHFFDTAEHVMRRSVFVLMPFRRELDRVYQAVKAGANEAGFGCVRADEITQPGAILVQVMQGIHESEAVVADLSGRNPNVFYELGMAHVRKEKVVLLAQDVDEVPFDLRPFRLLVYENSAAGRRRLAADLETLLASMKEAFPPEWAMSADARAFIAKRALDDPERPDFGANRDTAQLHFIMDECEEGEVAKRRAVVVFFACPYSFLGQAVEIASDEFRAWLKPNLRRYEPGGLFVPIDSQRPRADGALCTERYRRQGDGGLSKYLLIRRNGYVEYGRNLASCRRNLVLFRLTPLIAELHQFVAFVKDLYALSDFAAPFRVCVNLAGTLNSELSCLGDGWREPHVTEFDERYVARCDAVNLQFSIEGLSLATDVGQVDAEVRRVARDINLSYSDWEDRAFNHRNSPEAGQLNRRHIPDPWL